MLAGRRSIPLLFFFFLSLATLSSALHFYLDSGETRCFIEELPNETVVEGHYRALEWEEQSQAYRVNPELGILTEITEMETGHVVAQTRGPPEGRFTFTSHESGDHSLCLSSNYSSSWFGPSAHIRLYLDVVVGSTRPDADHDRGHVSELASKIRDLNLKLEDIRREQQYQREREADFRDLSEALNSRAVWYSVVQIGVFVATCVWQLRHLKHFFEDRKMH
ncbi:emp24/gp25L/p24 family/GOLD-domain-containing protein [Vararia minispora EC-137]|uniref:Emp24/gp25L/p24 family/GOLD-domain-containing protein n=1 Tax=Vararia minispora EC-137 TaxID=1314806 RepID=A0ACB8Q9W9_9AGAM|nr:emp24/gp25L/p24 family/GOLD-domain-containing protein [Vararia minispora EC-137]